MDSVDLEVVRTAVKWTEEGHQASVGTITETWGSAPRPVGSMLAIRDDGHVIGSVSGGCVEDDLIDRVKARALGADKPEAVVYGVSNEQAARKGLPCGGTLQLVIEPVRPHSRFSELLGAIERHELVARAIDMATGEAKLEPALWSDTLGFDGKTLRTIHGPTWRVLVIGAGQLSRYLAPMAQALGYHVTVCDPREEYSGEWKLVDIPLDRRYPDDVVLAMKPDAHMAVLALTHDPKLDDAALLEALKAPCFYVGALGSRKNNDARRKRLVEAMGLAPSEVGRLRGPVGLRIGSKTPPEIAISILAEMIAVRGGVPVPDLPPAATPVAEKA
jgi:xanthine dehydrogenase accessory factor